MPPRILKDSATFRPPSTCKPHFYAACTETREVENAFSDPTPCRFGRGTPNSGKFTEDLRNEKRKLQILKVQKRVNLRGTEHLESLFSPSRVAPKGAPAGHNPKIQIPSWRIDHFI